MLPLFQNHDVIRQIIGVFWFLIVICGKISLWSRNDVYKLFKFLDVSNKLQYYTLFVYIGNVDMLFVFWLVFYILVDLHPLFILLLSA